MPKLNKEVLDAIQEGEMVRDSEVKGLIATRTKTGGLTFKMQRDLRGQTIRLTLKTKDLKEARAAARQFATQVSAGIDPRMPPATDQPGPESWTVAEAMQRYMDKPSHRESTRKAIREHLPYLRAIENVRLCSLSKSACREAHERIPARTAADGAFRYLRAAYNYVADKFDDANRLPPNPTSGVHWGKARSRKLEPFDLATWSNQLLQVAIPRRQFHLLCLLGGVRVGTLSRTTWAMVDLSGRAIHYTAAEMKSDRDFDLPVSDVMVEVIKSIPPLHPTWVFPAASASGHLVEPDEPALSATGHQLRKMYRSTAEALGIPSAHAGALLDHAQVGLEKNYASRKLLREALVGHQEAISKELQRLGLVLPLALAPEIG